MCLRDASASDCRSRIDALRRIVLALVIAGVATVSSALLRAQNPPTPLDFRMQIALDLDIESRHDHRSGYRARSIYGTIWDDRYTDEGPLSSSF